ncbi:thiamine biosynthesis protein ThiC [Streptomyces hygroscopicus subsp. jinggangensis 5008]|nr:thiamine biosynthesis protein ThiC [Streptomyces hygroscopicus subsp. jinggangensis 5008]AGF64564.1 thiamine biosynthesis protein ThiC [Streptomyces hygroscopicus subsp. jinggangensis TL01]
MGVLHPAVERDPRVAHDALQVGIGGQHARTSSTGGSPAGTPRSLLKISQDIRREHGGSRAEIEEGMAQKSKEFAAAGNRVYLPIAD